MIIIENQLIGEEIKYTRITKVTIREIKKSRSGKSLSDIIHQDMESEEITEAKAIENFKDWVGWKGSQQGEMCVITEEYAGNNEDWNDDIPVVMAVG